MAMAAIDGMTIHTSNATADDLGGDCGFGVYALGNALASLGKNLGTEVYRAESRLQELTRPTTPPRIHGCGKKARRGWPGQARTRRRIHRHAQGVVGDGII